MTEKKDLEEEEEEEKTLGLPGASLEARIYTVGAVATVEHHRTAKATPTQRMNGRQTLLHVLTYLYVRTQVT